MRSMLGRRERLFVEREPRPATQLECKREEKSPCFPACELAPDVCTGQCERMEGVGLVSTDNTPAAALRDHLLPSMLVAQHCAASVDCHQAVETLDGDFINTLSRLMWPQEASTYYSEMTRRRLFPHSLPSMESVSIRMVANTSRTTYQVEASKLLYDLLDHLLYFWF